MRRRVWTLLFCFALCRPLWAQQSPLAGWVLSKGFKVRLNPNSSPLVGEIYPDRNINLGSRLTRMENCWPADFIKSYRSDDWKQTAASFTFQDSIRQTDIGAFLKLSRNQMTGSEADRTSLQLELERSHIQGVIIEAVNQFERPVSGIDIQENIQKDDCKRLLYDDRNVIVSNALGVSRLSYHFVDNNKQNVSASPNLLRLLFNLGISKDAQSAGTVEFDQPVYIGFQTSRWCGKNNRNAFIPADQKCK